nr:pantoate--beta-alanine ligase [uncultured Lichenicoccus sp.]
MYVARTLDELAAAVAALGPDLALVPTMGALHAGHLSLLAAARRAGRHAAASIFVNPTQFNQSDDLARYPRDEDSDLVLLRESGCHLAWLPSVEIMYPGGDEIRIAPGGAALGWEGDTRPGHFSGVATVVAKLLNQVRPAFAFFGEKDWQQLQVVRDVVDALFIPVRIEGVPTLRESDGLAMSSRNRFLTEQERQRAPALYRCLSRLARAIVDGDEVDVCLATAREDLRLQGFSVDYLALVAGTSLRPIPEHRPGARLLAAARLGSVRLLDNLEARPAG